MSCSYCISDAYCSDLILIAFFFFQAEDGIRDGSRDWSSDVCSSDLAKACGLAPIDTVHLAVKDEAGFREDAARGLHLGFEGKLCIHPRQVEIANAVFTPGPAQIRSEERRVGKECRSRWSPYH